MKTIVTISSIILLPILGMCQMANWQNTSGWRLYDTLAKKEHFNRDSINSYKSIDLDSDTMHQYLSVATLMPAERTKGIAWMGYYRVSCSMGDSTRFLLVSRYGGFFADLGTQKYYEIPLAIRPGWQSYFLNKFLSAAQIR